MNTTPTYQKVLFGLWGILSLTSTSLWTGAIADKSFVGPLKTCILYFKSITNSSTFCDTSRDYGFYMISFVIFVLLFRGFHIVSLKHVQKYIHFAYVILLWGSTIATIVFAVMFVEGLKTTCTTLTEGTLGFVNCENVARFGSDRFARNNNFSFATIQAAAYAGIVSSGLFFFMAFGESVALYKSNQVPDTLVNFKETSA